MRSCLALWLAHGDEASVSAAKASAANHGAVPVDTFCWRRIVLLHLDLRSRHPCPKRTARATCWDSVGWAKARPSHTPASPNFARRAHAGAPGAIRVGKTCPRLRP